MAKYHATHPRSAVSFELEATDLDGAIDELRQAILDDLDDWARREGELDRSHHDAYQLIEDDQYVTDVYATWHPPQAQRCPDGSEHELHVLDQRAAGAALEIVEVCGACGLQITTTRHCQCRYGPGDGSPHTCRIVEQPEYVWYVSADPADYGDDSGDTSPEEGMRIARTIAEALMAQFPWLDARVERPGEFNRDFVPEELARQVVDWLDQHWNELVDEALAEE